VPSGAEQIVGLQQKKIGNSRIVGFSYLRKDAPMYQDSHQGFRLSPTQTRLWKLRYIEDLDPYYISCTINIEGDISADLLETALQRVTHRHEILRTAIRCPSSLQTPMQVICDSNVVLDNRVDLSNLDQKTQDIEIKGLFYTILQNDFDFNHHSPLHISMIIISPCKHLLLIKASALCIDDASLQILVREIASSCHSMLQNIESTNQPIQYVDISEWQNELFETDEGMLGIKYWTDQDLSSSNLCMPYEKKHHETPKFKPQFLAIETKPDLAARIDAFTQQHYASIPIFLLTCWCVFLYRLIGNPNIVIGVAFNGRNYPELEDILGPFERFLPICCHMQTDMSFEDILNQNIRLMHESYKWQECFTWDRVKEIHDTSPFFSFCFDFEDPSEEISIADISFLIDCHYSCTDRFKIKLSPSRKGETIILKFHYDSSLFSEEDIRRIVDNFYVLLKDVINRPNNTIDDISIINNEELLYLLTKNNETSVDYPASKCINQLFEEQAERTPSRIAVVYEDQQLTYIELNARANRLAHYLQQLGVGPEVLVGICVERSIEMIIGILGILKAGGAYLPLDPAYPKDRLSFMLDDSLAPVLITRQQTIDSLPTFLSLVVCLDDDWEAISQESEQNPTCGATADNLAYVIYTSGSTGKPKGVLVQHRGVSNLFAAQVHAFAIRSDSRILQFASLSFDASIFEIIMALLTGSTLYLTASRLLSGPMLMDLLRDQAITTLTLPPSMLATLPDTDLPALQTLISAGEPCSASLVSRWASGRRFFNAYGPTETTVWATVSECVDERSGPPIGRPIANTQVFVLDTHLRPVPIGVSGELYIGGVGLARGYLNRPGLTAERFIPHPFSNEDGARLYRTGDLACYRPDGSLDCLGRIDQQVKIRGFRIELGEIETVLGQHPAVHQCVVIAHEDGSNGRRLIAYIAPRPAVEPTVQDLRSFLQMQFPAYMIPALFIMLPTLPVSPNGKVDRQMLPAPHAIRSNPRDAFVAPRNPIERALAAIWAEVLGVARVGIHDNFFTLGGDSILSFQTIVKAQDAGIHFTPKQMFQHQTIAELAVVVSTTPLKMAEQELVDGPVPLTPIQHWFFEQDLPEPHHYNQAVLLEVRGSLDSSLLAQAMQHLIRHHDALRMRFERGVSGWRQSHGTVDEAIDYTQMDLSSLPVAEQAAALTTTAAAAQASLDLAGGPLVRMILFELGATHYDRLFIAIHHLVIDGISWRILLGDLQMVYRQLSEQAAVQLPPKTTSFQQWAVRLNEYVQSAALHNELTYWLSLPWRKAAQLPVDYPTGANTLASAGSVTITFSVDETRALLHEVPIAYHTEINDVLLTALAQAMQLWTGTKALLLDLEGHGREELFNAVDLSRTVGWFTTVFPVLLDLSMAKGSREALIAIKEQLRQVPQHGIGYGLLRYLCDDPAVVAALRELPSAPVSFNYLGQLDTFSSQPLFTLAHESSGSPHSLQGYRRYLLDINGRIAEGQLGLTWTYSTTLHRRATIETWAHAFAAALRGLIAHCQSPEAGALTPSDFARFPSKWSQSDLDDITNVIRGVIGED
jgi:amino acid adenylation domain-containing protein/non-ribosomal peptide synthase protein (TIGR01720 family)